MSTTQSLTPREIVAELDRYVIGQADAKRMVAIALRNRWRRSQLGAELQEDILPKNIILIGPTGVGKTEIARRLARLAQAPFIKVEASKFTEVGYVGRDVESMVRDLADLAVKMVREERGAKVADKARERAEEKLLDRLLPAAQSVGSADTREKIRAKLLAGELDERMVDVEVTDKPTGMPIGVMGGAPGMDDLGGNLKDMLGNMFPGKTRRRKMTVAEAREHLLGEETEQLIDAEDPQREAVERVEQSGIIFLDEVDKIVSRAGGQGPDVSREGVQRDLLPIVEGSTVNTKYGMVRTDHILFIAAGAFHLAKPADMIPELQGRFPIRVELESLSQNDLVRILTEPHSSLTRQYTELMATEGVTLVFAPDGVEAMARIAVEANERTENIGARRLFTIMEKLLDEVSFNASDMQGVTVEITAKYVNDRLGDLVQDVDLSRYIL